MTLVLLTLASVTALALLIVERLRLDRSRENIPLVIAVTGTRGKSTVTRMLASVLRCNGQHVLAKTCLCAIVLAGIRRTAVSG
jgi:UDP-N-acetylmuramoylalanine-D-glutamate ligase